MQQNRHDKSPLNSPMPPGYIGLYDFSRKYGYDLVDLVVAKDAGEIDAEVWLLRTQGNDKIWATMNREDTAPPSYVRRVDYKALAKAKPLDDEEEIMPAPPLKPPAQTEERAPAKRYRTRSKAGYSRNDLANALNMNYKTLTYWARQLGICEGKRKMDEKEYLAAIEKLKTAPHGKRTTPARVSVEGHEYISLKEASETMHYSGKYLLRRAAEGRIPGARVLTDIGARCRPGWYLPADFTMPGSQNLSV